MLSEFLEIFAIFILGIWDIFKIRDIRYWDPLSGPHLSTNEF